MKDIEQPVASQPSRSHPADGWPREFTFTEWLLAQTGRHDPIGELARCLEENLQGEAAGVGEEHWPSDSPNLEGYLDFLVRDGASHYCLGVCGAAWLEYRRALAQLVLRGRRPTIPETGKVVEASRPECPRDCPPAA